MALVARISSFHSPDVDDLENWVCPSEPASLLVSFTAGPVGLESGDDFSVLICNVGWLQAESDGRPVGLRHHVLLSPGTGFPAVKQYLETRVNACTDEDWIAVAARIARFAAWEFEDYTG